MGGLPERKPLESERDTTSTLRRGGTANLKKPRGLKLLPNARLILSR